MTSLTETPSDIAEANVRVMRAALTRIHLDVRPAFLMGVLAYVGESIDPAELGKAIDRATDTAAGIGGVR